jgi:RimJ/RimL family protein N-acetyltransferase
MTIERVRIEWSTAHGELVAVEPTLDEVRDHVRELATAYNDAHNAPLLGHDTEISQSDVLDHYTRLSDDGARAFLLYLGGVLVGDADIRGIEHRAGEFAFMIAAPSAQGKGLGTAFAIMIHAFGFAKLPIDRLYASIIPANVASRRAFEKLGYQLDDSDAARELADPGDIVMSIDRETFAHRHAARIGEIRIRARER